MTDDDLHARVVAARRCRDLSGTTATHHDETIEYPEVGSVGYEYKTTTGSSGVRVTRDGKSLRNRGPSSPEPPGDDWELVGTAVEGEVLYWTWRRPIPTDQQDT